MKNILITGSTGMLGGALIRSFLPDKRYVLTGMGRSYTNLLSNREQVIIDFSNPERIKNLRWDYDIVIHTAALTDLALCENNPELATRVHVESTGQLAKKMSNGGMFFYISTDSVFDGTRGWYSEDDPTQPLNVYAKTKLQGEQASLECAGTTSVVRTNIFGFHDTLKNSLAEWAFNEWSMGKKISGYTDVVFNPVYTGELAVIIKRLVDDHLHYPVINVGSPEAISKFQFLDSLRRKLDFDEALISPSVSNQNNSIKRPLNTSLDTRLLEQFYSPWSISQGLDHWIKDLEKIKNIASKKSN
jgi:dTDP-4-dehydrorhamnose reductase